jgi:hypothetical protein
LERLEGEFLDGEQVLFGGIERSITTEEGTGLTRTLFFRASDVECWLRTGTWPAGVRFQGRGSADLGRQSNAELAPLSDAVTRYMHASPVHLDQGLRER